VHGNTDYLCLPHCQIIPRTTPTCDNGKQTADKETMNEENMKPMNTRFAKLPRDTRQQKLDIFKSNSAEKEGIACSTFSSD
jgi:hypothetical protein